MAKYVSEFSELVRRLTMMKIEIPEELLVVLLLEGLPESYGNFSTLIMMGRYDELKFDDTKETLKNEAQSRNLRSEGERILMTRT